MSPRQLEPDATTYSTSGRLGWILGTDYQGYRLPQPGLEGRLLASIAQRGIQKPLEGVDVDQTWVLLNGFKRYRCALQFHIHRAPFVSLGSDEASGISQLLCASNHRSLALLEQARFLDELKENRRLSITQIAEALSRSKDWDEARQTRCLCLGALTRSRRRESALISWGAKNARTHVRGYKVYGRGQPKPQVFGQ